MILLYEARAARHALAELDQSRASLHLAVGLERQPVASPNAAPVLPWFQNTQLVEQLHRVAHGADLPVDEVSYALEEGKEQPYLRYRITMTVSASYPAIKQFADELTSSMSHIDLDSISCRRADISVALLTCELAFSAFFRKDGDG